MEHITNKPSSWLLLVMGAAVSESALRVRVWRSLKALGVAVLRDGAYLAPDREDLAEALERHRQTIDKAGGSAFLFRATHPGDQAPLRALFDRTAGYEPLIAAGQAVIAALREQSEAEGRKQIRQLRRDYESLIATDYFPTPIKDRAYAVLLEAERLHADIFSPGEPQATHTGIERLDASMFRGRLWATRAKPWVDRVASAWLIRRFIDPEPTFLWLQRIADCPPDALGFDFNGARFTHVEEFSTFETLLQSFGLDADPALLKLAATIHYLDVGGTWTAEAGGLEAMLIGLREQGLNDDDFFAEASRLIDFLYSSYQQRQVSGRIR